MKGPLLPEDPSMIGGHRLLGRLGAGGMGVVYLGRAPGGALAAVKVVNRDLAEEPGFRLRFVREIEAARRVRGPWVTPVTGAGPDEPAPWLATVFVPGPSLGEAVQRFGPLPARSVGRLGQLLAAALGAVHAAGLVHRDVKPGNVLLALDGPRLIDFGIARSADATVLTAPGVVAGSPGFLSPEQAGASTADLGPPSDVFSLGCLLAYGLTGRPPFGHGTVEAILYRTVHDEPDLGPERDGAVQDGDAAADGLDADTVHRRQLVALLLECLAKDPAVRPSTGALERRLADHGCGGEGWLPGPVVRYIADVSARTLALPDVEPTAVGDADRTAGAPLGRDPDPAAPCTAGGRSPTRRRIMMLAGAGAAGLAAGGTALWAVTREEEENPSADARWALGLHADLSGPGKAVGRALERGTRLAVEQYNARPSKPFELTLRTADDRGAQDRSKDAAQRLAADRRVLAVLGPNTTASAEAAIAAYDAASLPVLFVVPGSLMLLQRRSPTALHCRADDREVAFQIAVHLADQVRAGHTGLLVDRTADTYAWEISAMTAPPLRDVHVKMYPRVVPAGLDDFHAPVADMVDANIDSFIYAGYADGAARVARDLTAGGFTGPRMGAQALLDPRFPENAGRAADGWLITASCVDAAAVPAAAPFRDAHYRRFGAQPGRFAAEAYDAANLAIRTMTGAHDNGRPPARSRLITLLRATKYRGITKEYAFERDTGRFAAEGGAFLYEVDNARFRFRHALPAPVRDR